MELEFLKYRLFEALVLKSLAKANFEESARGGGQCRVVVLIMFCAFKALDFENMLRRTSEVEEVEGGTNFALKK